MFLSHISISSLSQYVQVRIKKSKIKTIFYVQHFHCFGKNEMYMQVLIQAMKRLCNSVILLKN